MRAVFRSAASLGAVLLLASCGGSPDEPSPEPVQTGSAGPRTLVPEALDLASLGPRIDGPQGAEVVSDIAGLATLTSYVACPEEVEAESCVPDEQEEGTVYTYVHTVELDDEIRGQDGEQWAGARIFRTIMPVAGFSYTIGYDREQALATLGKDYEITTEAEDGELIWRISAGDGWMPGETLTFFWRSAEPPAGPQPAYRLEAEEIEGEATGPFPAAESDPDTARPS